VWTVLFSIDQVWNSLPSALHSRDCWSRKLVSRQQQTVSNAAVAFFVILEPFTSLW